MEFNNLKAFAQEARKVLFVQVKSCLDQAKKNDGSLHRNHPDVFKKLSEDLNKYGEETLVSKVAYFWFNRFCALRFMDLNGYTSSKVVSPEQEGSSIPGILSEAKSNYFDEEVVSAKTKEKINNLLNGSIQSVNPEAEVYRLLLISECNYWNKKMPFLFQAEDDYSEFLLPTDLLSSESILQSIRDAMTPDNCQSVEIIGWLYQFYISEKKDQIFKDLDKNIKITPENIPAATQLFTPEWIVRYLVDNSLGRLWMLNHPKSSLKDSMEYYIESSEAETDFLKINTPQEIKLCDPCCGSGHMLVYAFDLFYKIYEEHGYSNSEIPKLILENNLFGLELDERASELAGFALMMKAREKDRRVFGKNITPNICHIEKIEFTASELEDYKNTVGSEIISSDVIETVKQFNEADNFGSLIIPKLQNPDALINKLQELKIDDIFLKESHNKVIQALKTADYLSQKYHVVVTNPPYKGTNDLNIRLATWIKKNYPDSKKALCSAFIERNLSLAKTQGLVSMITMQSWMFLSSFEKLREKILSSKTIMSMAHLGTRAFDSFGGEVVATTAFIIKNGFDNTYKGTYVRLVDVFGEEEKSKAFQERKQKPFYALSDNFKKIPGSPIAFWLSERFIHIFEECPILDSYCKPAQGLATADNDRFLRQWFEVNFSKIGVNKASSQEALDSNCKWFPYNKGGEYRRWYGNQNYVINWYNNGQDIKNFCFPNGKQRSVIRNPDFYFKPSITWSFISSSYFGARYSPIGAIFDVAGSSVFPEENNIPFVLALMDCSISSLVLSAFNPTMNFQVKNIGNLPLPTVSPTANQKSSITSIAKELIKITTEDWDCYESSWNFKVNPLVKEFRKDATKSLEDTVMKMQQEYKNTAFKAQQLEEQNNQSFIELYDLEGEFSPDYPLSEVTLFTNTAFMYKDKSEEEQLKLQRVDMIKDLISYSVGCMFGRYSLDKEGLILCNQGESIEDFRAKVHNSSFEVDEDNVIPVLSDNWFSDDIVERFKNFLKIAFGEAYFLENLRFIEQTLNVKEKNSYSIRDYFVNEFYDDHVKRYKKRPIYWMFKSHKGHFKALIYMHRYQPYTVSRARNEYLLEFRHKLDAEKQNLESLISSKTLSKADNNAKNKRIEDIKKIINDINNYDSEIMYPLAQQNITIDLDDGVKTNYVKFGNALEKIPGLEKKED